MRSLFLHFLWLIHVSFSCIQATYMYISSTSPDCEIIPPVHFNPKVLLNALCAMPVNLEA